MPKRAIWFSRATCSTSTNSRLDLLGEAPPERRQGIVVGMAVGGDEAKRQRVVGRPLDLAPGVASRGVAVDEQRQQHRRVVRGATPA